ncbi:aryl-alcohol dehydrogenase-like predicted oxidoreductase [Delftia lacustris]|nr:aryl-alcohol dehydrogenase-like predicted oxidoreductase [Delftia lacustris]
MGAVSALAQRKGSTPAQIALAWLLAQGPDVVPIPGTRRIAHLQDNLGALSVALTPGELDELRRASDELPVAGQRYTEEGMKGINA